MMSGFRLLVALALASAPAGAASALEITFYGLFDAADPAAALIQTTITDNGQGDTDPSLGTLDFDFSGSWPGLTLSGTVTNLLPASLGANVVGLTVAQVLTLTNLTVSTTAGLPFGIENPYILFSDSLPIPIPGNTITFIEGDVVNTSGSLTEARFVGTGLPSLLQEPLSFAAFPAVVSTTTTGPFQFQAGNALPPFFSTELAGLFQVTALDPGDSISLPNSAQVIGLVPEPTTGLLMAVGLTCFAGSRRSRRQRRRTSFRS